MEIIKLPDTASTNDYLLGLNTDQDLCVVTDYQSAGKGMGTNTWESEPGKNLLFSILLHPTWLPINRQYLLSMAEAVAIVEVLGKGFEIKWPNDIYYGDKKLSGTRIDVNLHGRTLKDVIIGTGINVNQETFAPDIADMAGSLFTQTGIEYDRNEVIAKVMNAFEKDYELFLENENLKSLKDSYEAHLLNKGETVKVLDPKGEYQGTALGITDTGELIVAREDGNKAIVNAGEVSVRGLYGYV
jgi:BirA family biotin operon repressor/biotin-[acetyl-CoA-carboxylase] ligase